MKWNFECCRREGDYLHDRARTRRNDFSRDALNRARCASSTCTEIKHPLACAQHVLLRQEVARTSLLVPLSIRSAISLTADGAVLDFRKVRCCDRQCITHPTSLSWKLLTRLILRSKPTPRRRRPRFRAPHGSSMPSRDSWQELGNAPSSSTLSASARQHPLKLQSTGSFARSLTGRPVNS